VVVPVGTLIAGFGKGKWHRLAEGADVDEKELPYILSSDEDLVMLDGALVSVGGVVTNQRKANPEATKPT
jgi:hypothetical protein